MKPKASYFWYLKIYHPYSGGGWSWAYILYIPLGLAFKTHYLLFCNLDWSLEVCKVLKGWIHEYILTAKYMKTIKTNGCETTKVSSFVSCFVLEKHGAYVSLYTIIIVMFFWNSLNYSWLGFISTLKLRESLFFNCNIVTIYIHLWKMIERYVDGIYSHYIHIHTPYNVI